MKRNSFILIFLFDFLSEVINKLVVLKLIIDNCIIFWVWGNFNEFRIKRLGIMGKWKISLKIKKYIKFIGKC